MNDLADLFLKLLAATAAGALIGLNRDMHGKPTGVRLHALVAISSAVLVMSAADFEDKAAASRIIQGIVGGIGFLGAGVIMRGEIANKSREAKRQIYHLTTAASIWM